MATTHSRYRIDGDGDVWQAVRPGPRSPKSGWRALGTVLAVGRLDSAGARLRITLERTMVGGRHRIIDVPRSALVDERRRASSEG